MKTIRRAITALVVVPLLVACAGFAHGASAASAPAIEPRALDLIKTMSARLAAAQSFSFRARSIDEGQGKTSPFLDGLGDAEVAVMRPNRVRARVRGAATPFDLYFDGATMTAYQPTLNVYAATEASQALDALIPFALQNAGMLLPFADLLYGDAYGTMMKGITRARYAGVSRIGGKACQHAVFAGPGVEWAIWIDARTSLPCRVSGKRLDAQGAPRFAVEFSDWKLDPPMSAASFVFAKPEGASEIDIRALIGR